MLRSGSDPDLRNSEEKGGDPQGLPPFAFWWVALARNLAAGVLPLRTN
jgi:hypothetical protein